MRTQYIYQQKTNDYQQQPELSQNSLTKQTSEPNIKNLKRKDCSDNNSRLVEITRRVNNFFGQESRVDSNLKKGLKPIKTTHKRYRRPIKLSKNVCRKIVRVGFSLKKSNR